MQIPDESNGHVAIMEATVTMADGQVYTDYGDASPKNVNAKIATALIRMASTRAKGRALRDAINCGQTMLEELPDQEETRVEKWEREMPKEKFGAPPVPLIPHTPEGDRSMFTRAADVAVSNCVICNKPMTAAQITFCANQKPAIDPPAHMSCLRRGA